MTWLKVSDDFGIDCAEAGLSDAAFRTHVEGLLWSMRRLTGGCLTPTALRHGVETTDPDAAVAELVEAGFWERHGAGYRIVHGMDVQRTPEQVRADRDATAERQRRWYQRHVGESDVESDVSEPNGVSNGVSNGVTNGAQTSPDQHQLKGVKGENANAGARATADAVAAHTTINNPKPFAVKILRTELGLSLSDARAECDRWLGAGWPLATLPDAARRLVAEKLIMEVEGEARDRAQAIVTVMINKGAENPINYVRALNERDELSGWLETHAADIDDQEQPF
jgi:hypothetical protein